MGGVHDKFGGTLSQLRNYFNTFSWHGLNTIMFMVIQSSVVKKLLCPSLRSPSEPTPLRFDFREEFHNNSTVGLGRTVYSSYLYNRCKCLGLRQKDTIKQTNKLANKAAIPDRVRWFLNQHVPCKFPHSGTGPCSRLYLHRKTNLRINSEQLD